MVGQPILKIIPKERVLEEPAILEKLRRGERVDHFETQRITKDAVLVDVSLTISPIRDRSGKIVGASKIARDISAQRAATRALADASAETARQSQMKDEFLATLSHELRTPLQSVLGWVQILKARNIEDEEVRDGIEVIERNAQAQQKIIEDLLDMNRILSGKVRLDVQLLNLAPVIQEAVDSVKPAAAAKNVRLQVVVDPLTAPVRGDPQRLLQVIWNLLNNAVKFTPKNGRVEVTLQRVNSHLEVSVSDTGIGIDGEFLPHVFDRFRQADASYTRSYGGLGLGLAIVKNLVELHGGTVKAKSGGLGKGSTFEFALPLAVLGAEHSPSLPQTPSSEESQGQITATPYELSSLTIVLVDDDADSRNLVGKAFGLAGAVVRTAGSSSEALELFRESVPHIVVSDIGMPGQSGYDFIKALRALPVERGGNVPAIALTAYARVEDRVRALRSGFQALIAKPADISELIATVRALSAPN
jgi:signal transduction histidine kinase/CheY-like chemotaxis protein